MKSSFLILSLLTFVSIDSFSQFNEIPIDSLTGKVHFIKTGTVDSIGKEELFTRSKDWFNRYFRSVEDVILISDKNSGKLVFKAYREITIAGLIKTKTRLFFSINVFLKDEKYKIEVYDIYYYSYEIDDDEINKPATKSYPHDWYFPFEKMKKPNGTFKPIPKSYYDETLKSVNLFLDDLVKELSKDTGNNTTDNSNMDW